MGTNGYEDGPQPSKPHENVLSYVDGVPSLSIPTGSLRMIGSSFRDGHEDGSVDAPSTGTDVDPTTV